jgi:parafibromin
MSTADPLSLLRESTISNKNVVLLNATSETVTNISDAKTIKFNNDDATTFARDTPTNFKKTNAGNENDTYTLETLIFLVQNAQLDNSAYFKECRVRQIEHVSIVDRRKILDYLTGKVDQSPNVSQVSAGGKCGSIEV